jgi:hypothetical protein
MRISLLPFAVILLWQVVFPRLSIAAEPVFIARTADGKEVRGPLEKLGADWSVEIGKGVHRKIAGDNLLSIRQKGVHLPPLPTDEHLILANGDRLPVQEIRLDEEKLFFRNKDLGGEAKLSVPLSAVTLIWRAAPDREAEPALFRRRLAAGKRSRDQVLLRNGDVIEGTLHALGAANVEVEVNKKIVTALWKQVTAVALSTELADRLKPKGVHARVVLTEPAGSPGGRITLTEAASDGAVMSGKTVFGASVRFPLERLAQLDVLGGKAVALEDLEPSKYEYRPYLDYKRTWSAESNVCGRDIRLARSTYDRGIGMHTHSLLSFPLNGAYKRFEALVGLDEQDGQEGSVRVKVLLDGKEVDLGKKTTLVPADGAVSIDVPVEGAKTLTLVAEVADNGPILAAVDWVNARLVK